MIRHTNASLEKMHAMGVIKFNRTVIYAKTLLHLINDNEYFLSPARGRFNNF